MSSKRATLAAVVAALPFNVLANETALPEVVVTAPQMRDPLVVTNDPKAPQVPVPASDGASFLKNIPGFNVIRKGGTDGDPVLRGLAGSRLNVLLDGAEFHGGCGMRMDPPTAYVFPESFDRVVVVKGPQTVRYGNGNLAGVVSFERDVKPLGEADVRAFGSLMAGSWGRLDGVADATFGTPSFFLRAIGTHSESDNYEDGNGRETHSFYERKSLSLQGGWTPDANTVLTLSAVRSEANAAYGDRTMDGVVFDRDGYDFKFSKKRVSDVVRKIEAQYTYNYIDHVMDNYSLRTRTGNYMWNNPDRETYGLRASIDLALGQAAVLTLGADRQENEHTLRKNPMGWTPATAPLASYARVKDLDATNTGVYGELTYALAERQRLIGGLRHDSYEATRYSYPTGTKVGAIDEGLLGGFLRYEQDLASLPATAYIGIGHGERPMDHWEATTYNGILSTQTLKPEKNTQIDAGLVWNGKDVNASVSVYYSKIDDYLLTRTTTSAGVCPAGVMPMNGMYSCAYNVDATRYGLEADLAWRFAKNWTLRGVYAYVRADNDTMDVPLAQTPPQELRLGIDWQSGPWSAGALARFVDKQDRIHVGFGNIVGQDLGKTPGFSTFAINGSYRFNKRFFVSAGIDNLFDKAYAEHISRAGAAIAGYAPATTRVNEPGRFAWIKLNMTLD
ncbi:MAG: TonB-dependent copper receptor [Rhodocyclaceae bacterium]|nr:TonB-dependent copper receptor [Rhodocyclaceae bacterium]